MNIRIQTYGEFARGGPSAETDWLKDGTTAYDALMKGLEDLMDLCDVVVDKFSAARSEFARKDVMDLSNA
jgi:hypothetical protein